MGQAPSHPQPSTKILVIGAGLPRTGTTSFSRALEILLHGPTYHGGTQITLGASYHVKTWTTIFSSMPYRSLAAQESAKKLILGVTEGYAAITDTPGAQCIPELLELYPDAVVVCTVRDPDAWARSMAALTGWSLDPWLGVVLAPLPTLRHFARYSDAMLAGRWRALYCRDVAEDPYARVVWDRHLEWLREVVPSEKLFFFDVRDGWEPLCGILGCEVPKGVPFPKFNDGVAVEAFAKEQYRKGLVSWLVILTVCAAFGIVFWQWLA